MRRGLCHQKSNLMVINYRRRFQLLRFSKHPERTYLRLWNIEHWTYIIKREPSSYIVIAISVLDRYSLTRTLSYRLIACVSLFWFRTAGESPERREGEIGSYLEFAYDDPLTLCEPFQSDFLSSYDFIMRYFPHKTFVAFGFSCLVLDPIRFHPSLLLCSSSDCPSIIVLFGDATSVFAASVFAGSGHAPTWLVGSFSGARGRCVSSLP